MNRIFEIVRLNTHRARAIVAAAFCLLAASAMSQDARPKVGVPIDDLPAASGLSLPTRTPPRGYEKATVGEWRDCDQVRRRVSVLNPQLVSGQPLRLRIELQGDTVEDEIAEFQARLVFGVDLQVEVAPPGIPPFAYVPLKTGEMVPNTIQHLRRGHIIRIDRDMVMDPDSISGALFETPGKWWLRVVLNCPDAEKKDIIPIDMGTFGIDVISPEGHDAVAFKMMSRDPDLYRLLTMISGPRPGQVEALKAIAAAAPHAAIYPNIEAALSVLETPDVPDSPVAIRHLQNILESCPNHPVSEDALLRMLELCVTRGHKEIGNEFFLKVWQNPVMMTRVPVGSKLLEKYTGDLSKVVPPPNWDMLD